MKTVLLSLMMILSSSFASAAFFPQSTPEGNPILKCNESLLGKDDTRLNVQVYTGGRESLLPFVKVQRLVQGSPARTLFAGPVTQRTEGDSTLFFGHGMNMRVMGDEQGNVRGSIAINNGDMLKYFQVDCALFYQLQAAAAM